MIAGIITPLHSSTLSDYLNYIAKSVVSAGIAETQTPWTDRSLPSMALDTRFPAGMTNLFCNLTK
jgi:hypothetical protein